MQKELLDWYKKNHRVFPWRKTKDPYKIWISEIMLQQTQTTTVINYYNNWMNRFPDIKTLSEATLEEVYKMWEGLGYYSRVKNIYLSAKIIMENYNGKFPENYNEIRKLKGIGPYTAGAISSIAFNKKIPAVDGNVLRIIARYNAIKENIQNTKVNKEITTFIQNIIPDKAGDFNQALFDLGATICTPKNPKCESCPLKNGCKSIQLHLETILPINIKNIKKSEHHFITGFITYKDQLMLIQNKQGLLENLYGLIQYEVESPYSFIELFEDQYHQDIELIQYVNTFKHQFTHKKWIMDVYEFHLKESNSHLFKDYSILPMSTAHIKIIKTMAD